MTIKKELDAARSSVAGCTVAAYGDASTRLMLRSSHHDNIRRENLDELCNEAARCFGLLDATADLCNMLGDPGGPPNEAVVLTNRNSTVFVRSDKLSSEFLCLVCAAQGDHAAMSSAARQTLNKIAAAE
ncbi:hypothetical protein AAFO92_18590 [Roseovarius sp. CAU 1744]|uniref:hypothetical protein n=1 Tax=Roseovarius sp. CAU 1744 TaxID=3140368 RepID=UPI00325AC7FF